MGFAMYGICGWFGTVGDAATSESVLDAMLAACGGARSPGGVCVGVTIGQLAALAPMGGGERGAAAERVFADAGVLVAVSETVREAGTGRPLGAGDLADLYREHGDGLPARLAGSFALAVVDRERQRLLLAVDRIGNRPLYLVRTGDAIAFSTRLAALRRIPGFRLEIPRQALFDYLYLHMVPSPGTIYAGVEKLLPAQSLSFSAAGREARFYWQMPYQDDSSARFEDLREEFRALLPRVVERAAAGNPAVGTFLNGGTDSSTLAGTLRELRGRPVSTYSIGFTARGFDEIDYARIAARHFHTRSNEYYVTPEDVVESIPAVAAYCDEPVADASIVPAYLGARFARFDGTECLLAGDGGDELFGGKESYAAQAVFERYRRIPAALREGLFEPLAALLPSGSQVPPLRLAKRYIAQAKFPLPDRLELHNTLERTPFAEVFDPDFLAAVDTDAPLANLREVYARAASAATVNRLMHLDLKIGLADNDLRGVNQACGLAGVEVACPLLDDEMLEFAARIPPGMQVKGGGLRWFFKQAMDDFLPREIIQKTKRASGLPVGIWMAEHPQLRDLAGDSIGGLRRRNILQPAYIDRVQAQHADEPASDPGAMLWVLVMLEQWLSHHGH
jgi:asparagine synthase (glutamine-hydrolysing)